MVCVKRGLDDHLIPPPFLLLSLIPCAVQAAEPALHPFFLESNSTASSLSQQVLPRLFQSFPCSAEPGCSVTPRQARLRHCHHLHAPPSLSFGIC